MCQYLILTGSVPLFAAKSVPRHATSQTPHATFQYRALYDAPVGTAVRFKSVPRNGAPRA
eukprot:2972593-Rhodomonas_salina.1